jgi:hypothetical protein
MDSFVNIIILHMLNYFQLLYDYFLLFHPKLLLVIPSFFYSFFHLKFFSIIVSFFCYSIFLAIVNYFSSNYLQLL